MVLVEHDIQFDEGKFKITFCKYDLDGSHTLEFEEFCSLMVDMEASSMIVVSQSYILCSSCRVINN